MSTEIHAYPSLTDALFAEQYYEHRRYAPNITKAKQKRPQKITLQNPPPSALSFTASMIRNVYHNVALLRANWYGAGKKLITYTFGSAVMLTKNIALTCSHNIYSPTRRRFADQVQVLVGIEEGFVSEHYKRTYRKSIVTKNSQNNFFENFFTGTKGQIDREKLYFEYQPRKQQLTLIAISNQNLQQWQEKGIGNDELTNGLRLGNLLDKEMVKDKQLMIVGYPSDSYKQQIDIKNVLVNRQILKGHFSFIEAYRANNDQQRLQIINHTMPTSYGFSGSPILAVRDNQLAVIGIHTHRGKEEGINSGVYFDQTFLKVISEFEKRIKLKLEAAGQDIKESIRFLEGVSQKKGPQLDLISEQEYVSQSDEKEDRVQSSQSDHSFSKMDDLYNSSENSQMDDLGLLEYFTLITEECSSYLKLQSCRSVLIHPSLLYSDLDEKCPLADRNQFIIKG